MKLSIFPNTLTLIERSVNHSRFQQIHFCGHCRNLEFTLALRMKMMNDAFSTRKNNGFPNQDLLEQCFQT